MVQLSRVPYCGPSTDAEKVLIQYYIIRAGINVHGYTKYYKTQTFSIIYMVTAHRFMYSCALFLFILQECCPTENNGHGLNYHLKKL